VVALFRKGARPIAVVHHNESRKLRAFALGDARRARGAKLAHLGLNDLAVRRYRAYP
jgi:hypothetical protein